MALPENIRINNGGYEVNTRKGWENRTNFVLTLRGEVQHPSDTMYLAIVEREDGIISDGSFALGDIYKAKDFATALNRSTADGGCICLFTNFQLVQLVKHLIKKMKVCVPLYRKELVKCAGMQDGTDVMVVNPQEVVFIDRAEIGNIEDTAYVWLGKFPRPDLERRFARPTTIVALQMFLDMSYRVFGPEVFGVAILAWASMYGLNHYGWIMKNLRHFNLPVMFGQPMAGKSLIASCGAWLNGCPKTAIASRCTLPYITGLVTNTTMPFIWDDPTTPDEVSQLAIDLGNGAVRGKNGDMEIKTPRTGCLVTANFSMSEMLKYFSRIVLMLVPLSDRKKQAGNAKLVEEAAKAASASFPMVMKEYHQTSMDDVLRQCKMMEHLLHADVRILEGIALNVLFAKKLLNTAKRYQYMVHVNKYIITVLVPYYKSQFPVLGLRIVLPETDIQAIVNCIDIQRISINTIAFVKSGTILAVKANLITQRDVLSAKKGVMWNKSTKINGKNSKCVHVPVNIIGEELLNDIKRAINGDSGNNDKENVVEPNTSTTTHTIDYEMMPETVGPQLEGDLATMPEVPMEIDAEELAESEFETGIVQASTPTKATKEVQIVLPKIVESRKKTCGKCKRFKKGAEWIACDCCKMEFHVKCSRITRKELQQGLIWLCLVCKKCMR